MKSKYRPRKDDDRMSDPRPYDLADPKEMARLHHELEGYMRVSLKDGTDTEGRAFAYAALCELNRSRSQGVVVMDDAGAIPVDAWTLRADMSGKFMDVKTDAKPFKGERAEKET